MLGRQDFDFHRAIMVRVDTVNLQPRAAVGNIGYNPKGSDMRLASRFKENSLPDAAGRGVPTPLFAHGLLGILHRIFDPQHN